MASEEESSDVTDEDHKAFQNKYFCCIRYTKVYDNEEILKRDIGRKSISMTCPNCLTPMQTKISWISTNRTRKTAQLFSFVCCCFLPYYVSNWKLARHSCPFCSVYIGLAP